MDEMHDNLDLESRVAYAYAIFRAAESPVDRRHHWKKWAELVKRRDEQNESNAITPDIDSVC